jgi:hypothetical protein
MAKFAKELITSLTQAAKHTRGGKVKGMRVTAVELPGVKAIRRSLRMSQNRFSAAYRIPLATGRQVPFHLYTARARSLEGVVLIEFPDVAAAKALVRKSGISKGKAAQGRRGGYRVFHY